MKLIELNRVVLTGLLVCTLGAFGAYGQQAAKDVQTMVDTIFQQLTRTPGRLATANLCVRQFVVERPTPWGLTSHE